MTLLFFPMMASLAYHAVIIFLENVQIFSGGVKFLPRISF
jgi:hypothetical protein